MHIAAAVNVKQRLIRAVQQVRDAIPAKAEVFLGLRLVRLGLCRSGEGVVAELADAAVRADDEGQRERVPVLVGVGGFVLGGARDEGAASCGRRRWRCRCRWGLR